MARLLAAVAATAITVSILFGDSADGFDGGGSHPEPQPSLCDELILPAGYPCSEYTVLHNLTLFFSLLVVIIVINQTRLIQCPRWNVESRFKHLSFEF